MRLISLLHCAPVLSLALAGCTQYNPIFDQCARTGDCAAETGGSNDDLGDGDGDHGDHGDGDGEPGDGDGDGEPGDGDGEPDEPNPLAMLPTCPDTIQLPVELIEDTFLVERSSVAGEPGCVTQWGPNLIEQGDVPEHWVEAECKYLDFGALPHRSLCLGWTCTSMWLGRFDFDLEGWAEFTPEVVSAQITFNTLMNHYTKSPLFLRPITDTYEDWTAGPGLGDPAPPSVTTWEYAAATQLWYVPSFLDNPSLWEGLTPEPNGAQAVTMPLAPDEVAKWFIAGSQPGMLLYSDAKYPENVVLLGQESENPPTMMVDLCATP